MFIIFKKTGMALLLSLSNLYLNAQRIDHNADLKKNTEPSYLQFQYDNDFFTKTDYYYTQGINLAYGNAHIKNFILSKILIIPGKSDTRYSVGLNLASYTPTSISSEEILFGDRPFAATISFSANAMSTNQVTSARLSSSIIMGLIGPAAQGKQIQIGIHRWLKNITPHGWQHQVNNDIIINYEIGYERKLFKPGDYFLLNATAAASIGTLSDKLSGGFNFIAGNFNDPYKSTLNNRKVAQYYLYGQARVNGIGYDATLQGGLFNTGSPYSIPSAAIKRVSLQADAGIVVNFKKITLAYSQSILTKEFSTGRSHRWGGISVGVGL